MGTFALTAVGRDRPGIVAAVSRVLLAHEINVEDSQMTILRGHFAMTLILAAPEDLDREFFLQELEGVRAELELDAVSLSEIEPGGPEEEAPPSHIVSVYGIDHPGIVHAISAALADRGWNITDLNTRVVGEAVRPLYVMMIEVVLPDGSSTEELEELLGDVADAQGVDVTVRALDQDAL